MIVPFIWMISTSFKLPGEVISFPPHLIPQKPTLEHYIRVFTELSFARYYFNSLYIATIITLVCLFTSSLGGYVFAKFKFWGQGVLFIMILSTIMMPSSVQMVPLYLIMKKFHWLNTHYALIFTSLISTFGFFLMRQYMYNIPNELRESALIDGCSEFGVFWKIIFPLVKPALAALTIFVFMQSWDMFIWPLIVLDTKTLYTLPVGLATFSMQWWTNYALVMTGATVSVIPVLVVFLFMQRQFIEGIVLSGLKA